MSQNEVFDVLKNIRLSGDNSYIKTAQISRIILEGSSSGKYVGSADPDVIDMNCRILLSWRLIEACRVNGSKGYRIRLKVLEE